MPTLKYSSVNHSHSLREKKQNIEIQRLTSGSDDADFSRGSDERRRDREERFLKNLNDQSGLMHRFAHAQNPQNIAVFLPQLGASTEWQTRLCKTKIQICLSVITLILLRLLLGLSNRCAWLPVL